jgi:hypothetical protein
MSVFRCKRVWSGSLTEPSPLRRPLTNLSGKQQANSHIPMPPLQQVQFHAIYVLNCIVLQLVVHSSA